MIDILDSMMSPNIESSSGSNVIIRNDIQCTETADEIEEKRIEATQCDAVINSKCIKNTGYTPTSLCREPEPYCEQDFNLIFSRTEGKFENDLLYPNLLTRFGFTIIYVFSLSENTSTKNYQQEFRSRGNV